MLQRSDWKAIQAKCPKALAACRTYMETHFGDNWRRLMQQPEALRAFFEGSGVGLLITEDQGAFAFELILPWGRLSKDGWPDREVARREALCAAFRELELLLVRRAGAQGEG